MSDKEEPLISRETQDDVSSPPAPLYSYEGQQPPPYSAAPELCPPPKFETTLIHQPTTGYKSFRDILPEASADTTPPMAVRRVFVRKVLSILTLQLLFIFSVVCVFTFSRSGAVQTNLWAYLASIITFIVGTMALSYCKSFSGRHPWNIVGLVVVTLSLSYMVGTIASFHDITDVAITMGATVAISVVIIAFSAETRGFTIWSGVLLVLTVDLNMFVFMHILLIYH